MKTFLKILAGAVCALALASSVYGLWHVSIELAKMPIVVALGVVAVFDGSALVFGLKVAVNPKATAAWVGVISTAALSATAQVLAAPVAAEWWRLLHGAPAMGAIWALHNAVKDEKPTKRRPTRKADARSKGAGPEAAGVDPGATAPTGSLADESERNASVLQLDAARREGDRHPVQGAGLPTTPEQMASRVRLLLGESEPSQRRVWDLCKSIDPAWTQRDGRAVAAILKDENQDTGT